MFRTLSTIAVIAYRDVLKFLRDTPRIIMSFIFPILFVGVLGSSLQANLGEASGKDLLTFTFLGVLAQTMYQSTAGGIVSLIEDRENDYSQEIFVSPVSRYSILLGKIMGETMVSTLQIIGVIIFGLVIGVKISLIQLIAITPIAIVCCLLGGAFGIVVLANLSNQRAANQVFPLLIFPQLFVAGVFTPINNLPLPLFILSRIAPLTYAVDLMRNVYYSVGGIQNDFTLFSPLVDVAVIAIMFTVFLVVGTFLFVRNERNK